MFNSSSDRAICSLCIIFLIKANYLRNLLTYQFIPVTCDTIPDTSGGYFNLTSSGSVTQVKFTCPDGSTINGESTLTCGSDGAWGVVSFPMCGKR